MGFVVFAILLFAAIFVMYKVKKAQQNKLENLFNTKPEYAKDKTLRDFVIANNKRRGASQRTLLGEEAPYMNAGADIVAFSLFIDDDFKNTLKEAEDRGGILVVDVITPRVVIRSNSQNAPLHSVEQCNVEIKKLHIFSNRQTTKNASVVGRAAAGAAVAGGVGAVVGAASAVSANANGGITKTTTSSDGTTTYLHFQNIDAALVFVAIRKELMRTVNLQSSDLSIQETDNYFIISDPCMIDARSSYEQKKNEQYAQLLNSVIKNLRGQ